MLTDEQLKKIKFVCCSHIAMSTYYSSMYKSTNTTPTIYMYRTTPRHDYAPDELSGSGIVYAPKRRQTTFSIAFGKEYGRIQTLNKHVPIKLL